MTEEINRRFIIDEEHLKLLSLGYTLSAAISAFFSLIGLIYVMIGVAVSVAISHQPAAVTTARQAPPAFIGWIFAGIGVSFLLTMIALAALKLRTAHCIRNRKSRTFCMIVAGISCLGFPYGTALGVTSLIVLGRDSIARLFNPNMSPRTVV